MLMNVFEGILIPFVGTTLGAACVFFMRKTLSKLLQRALAGFAAGIMVAASIWSLLIPAIEQSENMGTLSFVLDWYFVFTSARSFDSTSSCWK